MFLFNFFFLEYCQNGLFVTIERWEEGVESQQEGAAVGRQGEGGGRGAVMG